MCPDPTHCVSHSTHRPLCLAPQCLPALPCSHVSNSSKPFLRVEGEWNGVMYIKHPNGVSCPAPAPLSTSLLYNVAVSLSWLCQLHYRTMTAPAIHVKPFMSSGWCAVSAHLIEMSKKLCSKFPCVTLNWSHLRPIDRECVVLSHTRVSH